MSVVSDVIKSIQRIGNEERRKARAIGFLVGLSEAEFTDGVGCFLEAGLVSSSEVRLLKRVYFEFSRPQWRYLAIRSLIGGLPTFEAVVREPAGTVCQGEESDA